MMRARLHGPLLAACMLLGPAAGLAERSGDAVIAGSSRSDIPSWWKRTRAIYCPFANSGAGSSLMKYKTGGRLKDRLESFRDLPDLLVDARNLGTDVVYLVDYWEPEYEAKGTYVPFTELGGGEALRDGIRKVHALGGRVLLYLEAFIISRKTAFGRKIGPEWAMMDAGGNYYSYYQTGDRFYLMYPGRGSGWVDHLVAVASRMARDYEVDGVHLDSYGLQWGWKDYHPGHPGGTEPRAFNEGAVRLVRRVREALRRYRREAVVILEGAEHTALLDVCDGAQIESLEVLRRKPWWRERRYPIFTSSFELAAMKAILDEGYGLALSPWWLEAKIGKRHARRLTARTDKRNRFDQLASLNIYNNLLVANGIEGALATGTTARIHRSIVEQLNRLGWKGDFVNADLAAAARQVLGLVAETKAKLTRTPPECIRGWIREADSARQP